MNGLVNASLYGGAFVLAVGLLCGFARRLPAWVRSWLWGIACAQFLVRLVLSVPIPVAVPAAQIADPLPAAGGKNYVISTREGASPAPAASSSGPNALMMLWGVGVAAGLAIAARRWQGAKSLIRAAVPVSDPRLVTTLEELTSGWRRKPRLLESAYVKCPLLVGCASPAIVVPAAYGDDHDSAEVRMALAHELAHIRRGDPWMALLVAATQTAFFFHPLAWWAGRESALAREEACDLEVLRLSEESPATYAHFLLKSAQARPPVAGLGAAYGYRNLRRRITMLKGLTNASLSSPRRTWLGLIAAGLAASLPWTVVGQSDPTTAPAQAKPAAAAKRPTKVPPTAKPAPKRPVRISKATAIAPASSTQAVKITSARSSPSEIVTPAQAVDVAPAGSPVTAAVEAEGSPIRAASAVEETTETVSEVKFGPIAMGAPLRRNVTAHFEGADIRASLLKVLAGSGANFMIKAKIQKGTLTGKFNDMSVHAVLEAIFQGIDQPLDLRFDRDVIYIVDRSAASGGFGGGMSGGTPIAPASGGLGGSVAPAGLPGGGGGLGGGSSAPAGLPGGANEADPTTAASGG